MVLELARRRALDGPVTGVVHSGRELVDEQLAVDVEELDGEDTHVLELVEELPDEPLRRGLEPLGHTWSGSEAAAQDPAVVVVLDERPARGCGVAPAHREHRELAVERHVRLEDERHTPELRPRPLDFAGFAAAPAPCRRTPLRLEQAGSRPLHGAPRSARSSTAANSGFRSRPAAQPFSRTRPAPHRAHRAAGRRAGGDDEVSPVRRHALPFVRHTAAPSTTREGGCPRAPR
jgi:hypothetical protein